MTAFREFSGLNPEPGDEVQHVTDDDGDLWKRTSKGWVAKDYDGEPIDWFALLGSNRRLVQALCEHGIDHNADHCLDCEAAQDREDAL